jgi:hypothetical protein
MALVVWVEGVYRMWDVRVDTLTCLVALPIKNHLNSPILLRQNLRQASLSTLFKCIRCKFLYLPNFIFDGVTVPRDGHLGLLDSREVDVMGNGPLI